MGNAEEIQRTIQPRSSNPWAETRAWAKALPKIELHRHLEGSLRVSTLLEIARDYSLFSPDQLHDSKVLRQRVQVVPGDTRNVGNFLSKFVELRQFYRNEAIIRRVATEAVIDAANDHIRYMELRFTPQALNNLIQLDYETIITWVCEAVEAGVRAARDAGTPITVALIISMNRHESLESGERALDAALRFRDRGVVALDLAGRELEGNALPFRPIFEQAKREGLGITLHAGEWAGADSVRDAMALGADRIGHGIRAIEDSALMDELAERHILLEVCPSSNVDTGVIATLKAHPLPELVRAGIATLNTDDPVICGITLSEEIVRVIHAGLVTREDVWTMMRRAAGGAFLPASERTVLLSLLNDALPAQNG